MALKKPTTPTAAANTFADKFEDEGSVATATHDTAADKVLSHFEPEASTAVAKAAATSVATAPNDAVSRAKSFQKEVEAMRDAADFSFGIRRTFKAKDGSIKEMKGDKLKLGRWAKVQMLAWGSRTEISPGEDGKGSEGFVAYSKDGKVIDYVIGEEQAKFIGTPVNDYVQYLKDEEDFARASKREMVDIQVVILDCDSAPDFHDIVQLTLSPSSIISFKQYQDDLNARAKCAAMGLPGFSVPENPFQMFFVVEDAENRKGQTWNRLAIKTQLPNKF